MRIWWGPTKGCRSWSLIHHLVLIWFKIWKCFQSKQNKTKQNKQTYHGVSLSPLYWFSNTTQKKAHQKTSELLWRDQHFACLLQLSQPKIKKRRPILVCNWLKILFYLKFFFFLTHSHLRKLWKNYFVILILN
jgi:hypothetical protein